jgi:hypothetical protein
MACTLVIANQPLSFLALTHVYTYICIICNVLREREREREGEGISDGEGERKYVM